MKMTRSVSFSLVLAATCAAQDLGTIYTLSNSPAGNAVTVTLRLPQGGLLPFAEFSTGGTGTGMGLGSQGAIAVSENGQTLLAVNPGSNELTLFRTFGGVFLWRQDTESSGGVRPTSVALHGSLVYVLNAGSDSIVGFRRHAASLVAIPGATYALSHAGAAAAQVGFSPDGNHVVVTERATNRIGVFAVQSNGTLGAGNFQPSAGSTPFGFMFRDDGTLIVSEAAGGAAGASVASSYRIQANGTLQTITSAAPTNQSAACWIAIPRSGHFAYTTNTGSGTVTGYSLNAAGALARLDASGVTGDLGAAARPIDADFAPDNRFLFVLDSAADCIRTFRRQNNGSLLVVPSTRGLADGAAGLVVR